VSRALPGVLVVIVAVAVAGCRKKRDVPRPPPPRVVETMTSPVEPTTEPTPFRGTLGDGTAVGIWFDVATDVARVRYFEGNVTTAYEMSGWVHADGTIELLFGIGHGPPDRMVGRFGVGGAFTGQWSGKRSAVLHAKPVAEAALRPRVTDGTGARTDWERTWKKTGLDVDLVDGRGQHRRVSTCAEWDRTARAGFVVVDVPMEAASDPRWTECQATRLLATSLPSETTFVADAPALTPKSRTVGFGDLDADGTEDVLEQVWTAREGRATALRLIGWTRRAKGGPRVDVATF
jgi:hypothetical protein